ncbi:hypothetical protein BDF19DRAFT_449502, partial [Syncephalis fuscata]
MFKCYVSINQCVEMILRPRGFHQVQWSPIGCSSYEGCLITAIADTGRKIIIYAPQQHPATFSWYELLVFPINTKLAHLQATALAWSEQIVRNNKIPACLAVGYQTGQIELWAWFKRTQQLAVSVMIEQAHTTWVSLMAWSPWIHTDQQEMAYLATACAMGSVTIWKVTISLLKTLDDIPEIKVELVEKILTADGRPCTVLKWCSRLATRATRTYQQLAIAKSTMLYVWQSDQSSSSSSSSSSLLSHLIEGTMPITG